MFSQQSPMFIYEFIPPCWSPIHTLIPPSRLFGNNCPASFLPFPDFLANIQYP